MSDRVPNGAIATSASIENLIILAWREKRTRRVSLFANQWPQWSREVRALAEVVVGEEAERSGERPWFAAGLTDDVSAWARVRLRGRDSGLAVEAPINDGVWLLALPEELLDEPIQFTALGEGGLVIDDLALGMLRDWCRGEELDDGMPAAAPDLVA